LLATLALTSVAALGHEHGALTDGHSELPTYEVGHGQPDRTLHIESATRVESSPCIACIHRQRQYAVESLAPGLDGITPSLAPIALEGDHHCVAGSYRLPASRAPPAA
jgi:hypothetical protein